MRLIRLLKKEIAREAAEWVARDIISRSQAEQICALYGVDLSHADGRAFAYRVLVVLGYLFMGLALIILIGANWDEIPRFARMTGLIAATMAVQGFALWRYQSGHTAAAGGLFLLGNLFFGASIILIAQIYHLGEHMPDGVFWWALGCLPLAVTLKNPWIMLQSLLLALVWFFLEVGEGFYPGLFLVFILAAVIVLYHGRVSILLFLATAVSIGLWIEYSLAWYWHSEQYFDFYPEHVVVTVALSVFTYVLGHWLAQRQSSRAGDYGAVLLLWTLRFGLIALLIMSFEAFWRALLEVEWQYLTSASLISAGILLAAVALACPAQRLVQVSAAIGFCGVCLTVVMFYRHDDSAVLLQILTNLVLICVGAWLIVRGIDAGISHYFFLGVAIILITALLRYIDLIGDYLGGAALFMLFALVLLGAAKYWKHHRSGALQREG